MGALAVMLVGRVWRLRVLPATGWRPACQGGVVQRPRQRAARAWADRSRRAAPAAGGPPRLTAEVGFRSRPADAPNRAGPAERTFLGGAWVVAGPGGGQAPPH